MHNKTTNTNDTDKKKNMDRSSEAQDSRADMSDVNANRVDNQNPRDTGSAVDRNDRGDQNERLNNKSETDDKNMDPDDIDEDE